MPQQLQTVGDIKKLTGKTKAQIDYAISRYCIEPAQRAGIIRLFDEHGVAAIRSALARIESSRGGRW